MFSRDTYCSPRGPCHSVGKTNCSKPLCQKACELADINPDIPRANCAPCPRSCRKFAPCDPTCRPCSPCQPCYAPGKAYPPCPPYGPVCQFATCGKCYPVARHDRWTWAWT